jgi:acyl-CoA thioesterase FadM
MSEDANAPTGHYLPTGEFVMRADIRAYEPGANNRVGIGNLLRYCEIAANSASAASGFTAQWYRDRNEGWVIFRQTIEFAAPVGVGQALDLTTWVRDYTRVASHRYYRLTRVDTGAVVARTETRWAFIERAGQTPRRIPAEIIAHIPLVERQAIPPRPDWPQTATVALAPTQVEWWARGYEADSLKHVNNCVYGDWLAESARLAFDHWGNATPTMQRVWLPRRLTINYLRSARPGDVVTLTTQAERVHERGAVLAQSIALRDDPTNPLVTATAWYIGSANASG